jgi:hypothetical protein
LQVFVFYEFFCFVSLSRKRNFSPKFDKKTENG